ncbi:hypothetical protein HBI56_099030 [Parastagonospora nodorum]|uniref:Uncharacterized protein n=1 Tax=Phaeosphaeria nodorum (strain SN15 / ATCC MYA-4574 / FGSC 10173) TaxID=321614 RepID=A0A7U2I0T2_PHANO|nr:hypothetical protein HBH56_027990 [Parastagonospora nodorum]QRC99075.1 hypothetical protein JI435_413000 [Parastagonospora nodorum SN15]KAH3934670.1 hypothetical protein HBH54_054050 [Parastagonospora nodorum]KAH3949901.1 hypothetical protein HBH53_081710 [Parastagonospora nodorum]KAH4005946.1 hypothetical protein HBI10_025030 [Parastagonospora nodorum]
MVYMIWCRGVWENTKASYPSLEASAVWQFTRRRCRRRRLAFGRIVDIDIELHHNMFLCEHAFAMMVFSPAQ